MIMRGFKRQRWLQVGGTIAFSLIFVASGVAKSSPAEKRARKRNTATRSAASHAAGDKASLEAGNQDEKGSAASSRPDAVLTELTEELRGVRSLIEKQQQQIDELQRQVQEARGHQTAALERSESAAQAAVLATQKSEQAIARAAEVASQVKPSQSSGQMLAGWDGSHFFMRNDSGSVNMNFEFFGQLDFRGYQSGNHPPNTFAFRRAEGGLRGTLLKYYDFRFQFDLTDGSSTLLRDAWVNIHRGDALQIKAGQFREPFSQEEYRGSEHQDFVERSALNAMAPGRTPGAMIHGQLFHGAFSYAAGAFNGKGVQRLNTTNTPETIVNLRATPWKNSSVAVLKGLTFGGAYAQGRDRNGSSFIGRSSSRSFVFFGSEPVNGKITRANAEMQYLYGPFALRAEYDQATQYRENLGPGGTNLTGVTGKGFMAQTTYLLTGETKNDSGAIAPRRPVFGAEGQPGGLGAWELKFRYDTFQLTDGTSKGNRLATYTAGVNWHLNKFVRYVLDFGVERFQDPVRRPNPADRNFFVVLSRIQVMIY